MPVSNLTDVESVAAGGYHSLAVRGDGSVWSWGQTGSGQLGDGTTTTRLAPVQVSGLSGVRAVAAGRDYSLAVKSDGSVWGWGANYGDQLGTGGTPSMTDEPIQITGVSGVVAMEALHWHSLVVKADGTVWGWGDNSQGQLGDGTTVDRDEPVQASALTGVVAVSTGKSHSAALKADGTV